MQNTTITTVLAVLTDAQLTELFDKAIDTADRDLLKALQAENIRRGEAEAEAETAKMREAVAAL